MGFKARMDPSRVCFAPMCNGFLRFTSGVTAAGLLVARMAVKPFSTHTLANISTGIAGAQPKTEHVAAQRS